MNTYAYEIDLNNPNQSWTRLITWVGRDKRVLDVGCGRGQIGHILHTHFNCQVTGLEINREYAKDCQGYERVLIGNIEDEAFLDTISGRYDVIICGDVLEHLRTPERLLNLFHSLLATDGHLLISVPNVAQIRIRVMHLRGRWDYTSEGIMDKTHLRWFTLDTIRAMLTTCGWREEDFDYILGPNVFRLLQLSHLPKTWLSPSLFAGQFLMKLVAA